MQLAGPAQREKLQTAIKYGEGLGLFLFNVEELIVRELLEHSILMAAPRDGGLHLGNDVGHYDMS